MIREDILAVFPCAQLAFYFPFHKEVKHGKQFLSEQVSEVLILPILDDDISSPVGKQQHELFLIDLPYARLYHQHNY